LTKLYYLRTRLKSTPESNLGSQRALEANNNPGTRYSSGIPMYHFFDGVNGASVA
jgi:hypothetical protein